MNSLDKLDAFHDGSPKYPLPYTNTILTLYKNAKKDPYPQTYWEAICAFPAIFYAGMKRYQPTMPCHCISIAPEKRAQGKTNYNSAIDYQQDLITYRRKTYTKINRGFRPPSL